MELILIVLFLGGFRAGIGYLIAATSGGTVRFFIHLIVALLAAALCVWIGESHQEAMWGLLTQIMVLYTLGLHGWHHTTDEYAAARRAAKETTR